MFVSAALTHTLERSPLQDYSVDKSGKQLDLFLNIRTSWATPLRTTGVLNWAENSSWLDGQSETNPVHALTWVTSSEGGQRGRGPRSKLSCRGQIELAAQVCLFQLRSPVRQADSKARALALWRAAAPDVVIASPDTAATCRRRSSQLLRQRRLR